MIQTQPDSGLLLDTHVVLWLMQEQAFHPEVQAAVEAAQDRGALYLSDFSLWELGTAVYRKRLDRRPYLQGLTLSQWIPTMQDRLRVSMLSITHDIALEAAEVPAIYGSGDPGDCFLIATARVHSLALVTRDERILALAADQPEYLGVLGC